MQLEPINPYRFGITVKPPRQSFYAPNCWNVKRVGKFKGYTVKIYDNYTANRHSSTLIVLSKANQWIKSKLKYIEGGKLKTLWSYAGVNKGKEK